LTRSNFPFLYLVIRRKECLQNIVVTRIAHHEEPPLAPEPVVAPFLLYAVNILFSVNVIVPFRIGVVDLRSLQDLPSELKFVRASLTAIRTADQDRHLNPLINVIQAPHLRVVR